MMSLTMNSQLNIVGTQTFSIPNSICHSIFQPKERCDTCFAFNEMKDEEKEENSETFKQHIENKEHGGFLALNSY